MRAMYVLDDEACRESVANIRRGSEEPRLVFVVLTVEEALKLATDNVRAGLDFRAMLRGFFGEY